MDSMSPWTSPGQNPGVGSLSLPPGISPTQELDPGLLHCRRVLYQLSHNRSPGNYRLQCLHQRSLWFQDRKKTYEEQAIWTNPTIDDSRSKSKPVFGKSPVRIAELHPRVVSFSCHRAHFSCPPAVSRVGPKHLPLLQLGWDGTINRPCLPGSLSKWFYFLLIHSCPSCVRLFTWSW